VTASRVQAVVLAGGKGTRMRSVKAKVLHPVLGAPLLDHVLRAVRKVSAEPVFIVAGYQADAVEAAFAGRGVFVRQEPPLGSGHALRCAQEAFSQRPEAALLVVNGDLPLLRGETLAALLDEHRKAGAAATILTLIAKDGGLYGRVLRGEQGNVRAVVEASDASPEERQVNEVNAGAYVFDVPSLNRVLARLQPRNAQREYYITDLVELLVADGAKVGAMSASDPGEAVGVNTQAELAEATRLLARRQTTDLMSRGVMIEDPESTFVGPDAFVEADVVLKPFTILEGRTLVRTGAVVGPFVRLLDSEVGPRVRILDHCLLLGCVVEADATIGPFAHIRPESHIGVGAKVGNFVELKKTSLGEGSKAPHLSYLGDATIGPRVNVGAGTITCNYDGSAKHPTRIGAGAFIGSDTTLVAPVVVGEGAFVAAGSAITEDVPPDSLALGRARQVIKEGWARQRRERAKK